MFHVPNTPLEIVVYSLTAIVLLFLGYRAGRWASVSVAAAQIAQKEQDLFTAQRGFKQLYEAELERVSAERDRHRADLDVAHKRVEDYRKKAAGFGGLFGRRGSKRADAMYALLLENEALEEALHAQSQKLGQERKEAFNEQQRATGYRRVLISQLMKEDRLKGYVPQLGRDDPRHPDASNGSPAPRQQVLPGTGSTPDSSRPDDRP